MTERVNRRAFLQRSVRAAAGVGVVGGVPGLLAGCGSTSGPSAKGGGTPGVSARSPKRGGALTFSVDAETDGFDPLTAQWAQGGIMYARTVFDPLAVAAADGTVQPYLAQAITPNATYDRWTIRMRPGVVFHDGEPCDAKAVATYLSAIVKGISGVTLQTISDVKAVNDSDVLVTMKEPWPPFPAYLTGQIGYVASPRQLSSPNASSQPIGTGPFVFKEWVRDDHFTATRNPHYWRAGMPYLDTITFRPIVDSNAQEASLRSGGVDIISTNATTTMIQLRSSSSFAYLDDSRRTVGEPGVNIYLLNTQARPLDDLRVRQALAYATDIDKIVKVVYNGIGAPMRGLFQPGSPYYAPSGYSSYDLAKAKALVAAYRRQKGPVSFTFSGTNDPLSQRQAQVVQAMWKDAGMAVQIKIRDDSTYINDVLEGKYQVGEWTNYAAADPDQNYIFWDSKYVSRPGSLAINFSRFADPTIDKALAVGRQSSNPTARANAYKTVSQQLSVNVAQLWVNRAVWAIVAKPTVENFANPTLPNGGKALPLVNGEIWPTQIWLS